jgi:hypothetical protein
MLLCTKYSIFDYPRGSLSYNSQKIKVLFVKKGEPHFPPWNVPKPYLWWQDSLMKSASRASDPVN